MAAWRQVGEPKKSSRREKQPGPGQYPRPQVVGKEGRTWSFGVGRERLCRVTQEATEKCAFHFVVLLRRSLARSLVAMWARLAGRLHCCLISACGERSLLTHSCIFSRTGTTTSVCAPSTERGAERGICR